MHLIPEENNYNIGSVTRRFNTIYGTNLGGPDAFGGEFFTNVYSANMIGYRHQFVAGGVPSAVADQCILYYDSGSARMMAIRNDGIRFMLDWTVVP